MQSHRASEITGHQASNLVFLWEKRPDDFVDTGKGAFYAEGYRTEVV